jgi:glycosyltransferase involved in cell wall biosynthesis
VPPTIAFYQSSPQHLYGGQLDILRFLEHADRSKLTPHVLVPAEGPFVARARALGLPVTLMPLPEELAQTGGALLHGSAWDRIRQTALLTPWTLRLARWLRAQRIDVLYANNRRAVLTTGPAARLARVPLFWHIKQDTDRGRMDALAMRLMTYAAGCSRDVQRAFQQRHPADAHRIGYVSYGIPLEPFTRPGPDMRSALGIPPDARVIGLVGSITPRKGPDLFVQAALRLAAAFPDVHFLLAGDAPEAYQDFKQGILTQAQPLMAEGRFHAPGWVADMPAFYRTLDVLALPSRIEGFGLVIIEAAAAGVPAVRSATGGHTESTREGETGFVVPVEDVDALTDRLARLLADEDLRQRMGQAAREYVLARFGIQRFVDDLTQALLKTANG